MNGYDQAFIRNVVRACDQVIQGVQFMEQVGYRRDTVLSTHEWMIMISGYIDMYREYAHCDQDLIYRANRIQGSLFTMLEDTGYKQEGV